MLYEIFAIALTIFNLEGKVVHTQYIEMPQSQTCFMAVEDYTAPRVSAECVLLTKKMDN